MRVVERMWRCWGTVLGWSVGGLRRMGLDETRRCGLLSVCGDVGVQSWDEVLGGLPRMGLGIVLRVFTDAKNVPFSTTWAPNFFPLIQTQMPALILPPEICSLICTCPLLSQSDLHALWHVSRSFCAEGERMLYTSVDIPTPSRRSLMSWCTTITRPTSRPAFPRFPAPCLSKRAFKQTTSPASSTHPRLH